MKNLMQKLWNDEAGFVVSAELVLVSTIAVLGLIAGLNEVRDGIVHELEDVGSAFGAMNQTYVLPAMASNSAQTLEGTSGSLFGDLTDAGDEQDNVKSDPDLALSEF